MTSVCLQQVRLGSWLMRFLLLLVLQYWCPYLLVAAGQASSDMASLLAIKHALITPAADTLSDWIPSASSPCKWYGVTCSNSSSGSLPELVTALDLSELQIQGTISPQLAGLTGLKQLNLSNNGLEGPIPDLSTLLNLEGLDLSSNWLVGGVPPSLAKLSRLQLVNLSYNSLSGSIDIPGGALPAGLRAVDLSGNQLVGHLEPAAWSSLKQLELLAAADNLLEGPLSGVWELVNLRHLDLGGNALSGPLGGGIGMLTKLRHLSLEGNLLNCEIPEEMGGAGGLEYVDLASCGLRGVIPGVWRRLHNLTWLDVSDNALTGGVEPVLLLPQLAYLDLGGNLLSGRIPQEELWSLVHLRHLDLGGNSFVGGGGLSAGMLNLTGLTGLDISGCGLGGSLPERIGYELPFLETLVVDGNGLSGSIPESVGQLTALRILSAAGNRLSGPLPASLGKCAQLTVLNLAFNSLEGPIPEQWAGLRGLGSLSLQGNRVSGAVPAWFPQLPALTAVTLSSNRLEGGVPWQELGRCRLLATLALDDNSLTGSIADGEDDDDDKLLCRPPPTTTTRSSTSTRWAPALRDLNLGHNRLSGPIGRGLRWCLSLNRLELRGNLLNGSIPGYLVAALPQLQVLGLEGNQLSGPLPEELWSNNSSSSSLLMEIALGSNRLEGPLSPPSSAAGNLPPRLQYLKLDDNRLTGSLPASLGNLTDLAWLSVRGNSVSGAIPAELFRCAKLSTLNLGSNQLSGPIPQQVGRLHSLEYLDLSHNALSGDIPADIFCGRGGPFNNDNNNQASYVQHRGVLDLSWNRRLTGIISSWPIGDCTLLVELQLAGNALSGSIPGAGLARLPNLTNLDLSHNSLDGSIPAELGDAPRLQALNLAANRLTGPIPPQLRNLRSLAVLNLSSNGLEGGIPDQLPTDLYLLDVSANKLAGEVPPSLSGLLELAFLHLGDNRLSGGISALLSQAAVWRQMQLLNLSCNSLSGPLPPVLGKVTGLSTLDLHGNRLGGHIPQELAGLAQLTYLDVADNLLGGTFPAGLCALEHLVSLNVSHNQLRGNVSLGGDECGRFWPAAFVGNRGLCYLSRCQQIGDKHKGRSPLLRTAGGLLGICMGSAMACLCVALAVRWWLLLHHHHRPSSMQHAMMKKKKNSKDEPQQQGEEEDGNNSYKEQEQQKQQQQQQPQSTEDEDGYENVSEKTKLRRMNNNLKKKNHSVWSNKKSSSSSSSREEEPLSINVAMFERPLLRLSLADILHATDGFCKSNIIGDGGFGTVYKAVLPTTAPHAAADRDPGLQLRTVAIKKLAQAREGQQGTREFLAEMETLGKVKHPNLVPLLGYCSLGQEKLLVYEYMAHGSLDLWLRNTNDNMQQQQQQQLDWPKRMRIAQGAARGLAFLHHGFVPHIIHRDVKASNILLDHHFEPRVADFGLARLISAYDTHVSTDIAGTFGYIPPEYAQTWRSTTRGDVYSFGVILLELLTGKEPTGLDFKDVEGGNLVGWARQMVRHGFPLHAIVDPAMPHHHHHSTSMLKLLQVATLCTADDPVKRPTMLQVVKFLNQIDS